MDKLDWRDFGAIPDGAFDCTTAINQCFAQAIATGLEAHGPAGIYKITGALRWNDSMPRISGMGAKTVIAPTGTNFDWLTVGTGNSNDSKLFPAGWVRDLRLAGPSNLAPSGDNVGFKLDAATFVEVRNVSVHFAPIGFRLAHNSHGCSFFNCRTVFDECRLGLHLPGSGSPPTVGIAGNDHSFYNCWFHGRDAAVWIDGGQGFYHFHGGQLLGGVGATTSDDRGACLTMGKSLATGQATGTCGASFIGTTFERAVHGWSMRLFGAGADPNGISLHCTMCSFFGGRPATSDDTIGVLKLTGGYNDILKFDCCAAHDVFTSAVPMVIQGAGGASRPYYSELGSRGKPSFAGQVRNLNDKPMLALSSIPKAHTQDALQTLDNGIMLFWNDATDQILVSTNYGATFPNKLSIIPV